MSTPLIYFTKFLSGMPVEQIGQTVARMGFAGLDLAVRHGQVIHPDNAREVLPGAVDTWRGMGLSVPLATLEADWTDPDLPELRDVYRACGEAGVPCIKLGYWFWNERVPYWDQVGTARASLEKFEALGREHQVCTLVHNHSAAFYGCNASAAMHLVRGFDPQYIGVYLDSAHLKLAGEPLAMALDMVGPHLKRIAVKNARHVRTPEGKWAIDWCALEDGLVDWPIALRTLADFGYDGPISVHGEYSESEQTDRVLQLVEHDVSYLQRIISEPILEPAT